ncbi:MAG: hypothetical protein Q4B89_01035 [Lachnospiraceae bacterium]|nr:hypothetical protein [Lachnospiraceae bacterium]
MVLCERFPSLSPLSIREYEAVAVFELVADLSAYIDRQERKEKGGNTKKTQGAYKDKKSGKNYYMIKITK